MKVMSFNKNCLQCNKVFISDKLRTKYCSVICRRKTERDKTKKCSITQQCKHCNKQFDTVRRNVVYCSYKCGYDYCNQNRKIRMQENIILIPEIGIRIIYTTCGKEILVDANLYDYLNKYKWVIHTKGYASTGRVLMHHLIKPKELIEGCVWDHKDRNKLNNTSVNLRSATKDQNRYNHEPRQGRLYKGVFKTKRNKYTSRIRCKNIVYELGTYNTAEEAAIAYNNAAIIHHGEFAYINKIQGEEINEF